MVILGFPGVQALDLVGPYEVFSTASQYLTGTPGYDVSLVSSNGSPTKKVRKLPARKWEGTAAEDDLM